MVDTAWGDGHRTLYHWQPFDTDRLRTMLVANAIYCSRPSDFNDPWDCKPHFNTAILDDSVENERHIAWAADLCRRRVAGMSEADIGHMRDTLRRDRAHAVSLIEQLSNEMVGAVADQYRVYCLGPDVGNLLMWSHYADNHRGVCLEFSLRNNVMCSALRCEYLAEFPLLKAYAQDEAENLRIVLAKSDVWGCEKEYRLVAQERSKVPTEDPIALLTDKGMLKLPDGALVAIIVGCQAPFEDIRALVAECAPSVKVRRAVRIPNRYAIRIDD